MKKKKPNKRSKRTSYGIEGVRKQLASCYQDALSGEILAIDPSCVSVSSVPGYAIYKAGELVESGTVKGINPYVSLEKRLQLIGKYCREHFNEPDILAIEHIQMGGAISMQSTIRATGAIIGSFECEHVIGVSPLAWQAWVIKRLNLAGNTDYKKYKEYKSRHKSDEEDAKWIGYCIIELAKEIVND